MGNVKATLTALGTFLIIPPLARHAEGNLDFLVCVLTHVSGGFWVKYCGPKRGTPLVGID